MTVFKGLYESALDTVTCHINGQPVLEQNKVEAVLKKECFLSHICFYHEANLLQSKENKHLVLCENRLSYAKISILIKFRYINVKQNGICHFKILSMLLF